MFLIIVLNLQPNNISEPTGYQPSEESCAVISTALIFLKQLCCLHASIPQSACCWTILFSSFSMNT